MIILPNDCSGQRFMRQGFSNNEDFGSEMKLDPESYDAALGMTREMFLMQDLHWSLPPIEYLDTCDKIVSPNKPILDGALRNHINHYLGGRQHRKPLELQLYKKRGKYGLRAVGTMDNGKKLRAFWRQSTITQPPSTTTKTASSTTTTTKQSDFLTMSYDDAIRLRLLTVEFEIQLPPLVEKTRGKKQEKLLPSVIYQIPIESGSMNPKAILPRGVGKVFLYPQGRPSSSSTNENNDSTSTTKKTSGKTMMKPIEIGTCRVGVVPMRAGIVDPSWSKGKPIFRKGRFAGLM